MIRKIIDLQADSTIQMDKVGQKAVGNYLGFKTVTTGFGPSKLHVLAGEGGTLGVWGGAQLDAKLATVPKGALTFVTFTTKSVIKNGKRTPKGYDVEYDDENIMDIGNVAVSLSKEPAEDQEYSDPQNEEEAADTDPYDDSDDGEEAQEPIAPPIRAAFPKGASTPVSQSAKDKAAATLAKFRAKA